MFEDFRICERAVGGATSRPGKKWPKAKGMREMILSYIGNGFHRVRNNFQGEHPLPI